ncbi:hypothetical protein Plec18170_009708 [Paecilomyces lecythidis]
MKSAAPKDPKATDRKRSEGVISKAHQYSRICKADIAVFIRNEDGKCKAYQSSSRKTWKSFFEQLVKFHLTFDCALSLADLFIKKKEEPWIVNIAPEDLDDNGRKKKKRSVRYRRKPPPADKRTNDGRCTLQLPEFPSIDSDHEEWLLLAKKTDASQDEYAIHQSRLNIPGMSETISSNGEVESPSMPDLRGWFPEPPAVEIVPQ